MKQYTFFSRDYFHNCGDYAITGAHYYTLLQYCFQYAQVLSLIIHDNNHSTVKELEKWRILNPSFQKLNLTRLNQRCFYYTCKEVYDIITRDGFVFWGFDHQSIPAFSADPVFLRKDGTVFFEAIIHEGEYSIYPRQEEDVYQLFKFGHWMPIDVHGIPEVPASKHQLPPVPSKEILSDSLYILLKKAQECPCKYLNSSAIGELIDYIRGFCPIDSSGIPVELIPKISFLPRWYRAFELFVLGELNAMTNSTVSDAFSQAGYTQEEGFVRFFELLEYYVTFVCP